MASEITIEFVPDLVGSRLLAALITFYGRCFEAEVDLHGSFTIRSNDHLPIPLYVIWWSYQQIHTKAVEMKTGVKPDHPDPDFQITNIDIDDNATNEKILSPLASGIPLKLMIQHQMVLRLNQVPDQPK